MAQQIDVNHARAGIIAENKRSPSREPESGVRNEINSHQSTVAKT